MKKQKGFTLVECIVALAVLGIAAMVMAQVYSMVCKSNEMTHRINESLSQTVGNIEKQTGSSTEVIKIDTGTSRQITFKKKGASSGYTYTMDTTMYVYKAQDSEAHGKTFYDDPNNDPIGLRYKYFD